MRQRQFPPAAFRILACQSRTNVPTRARRSTLPATQVVRKRTLLALGATHVGGSPPTSAQGRSSKPDATFHPARWAAQAAKRISHDPPRLPRDRHRPLTAAGIWLLKVSSRLVDACSLFQSPPNGKLKVIGECRLSGIAIRALNYRSRCITAACTALEQACGNLLFVPRPMDPGT